MKYRIPFALAGVILCVAGFAAHAEVRHVVSLNPCLDVVLVNVADREQIAALSHWSRDPEASMISEIARTFPYTHESAEEILALEPDLVLTSRHSDLATRNALRRMNVTTQLFDVAKNVADSLAEVRLIASLVNRSARGEALIARIEDALRAAAPDAGTPPVPALIFQRGGFSTGPGTLVNEMLMRTGFENVAARYGLSGWGLIPLERVLAEPPALLLAGAIKPGMPTWADRVMRHPALKSIAGRMKQATFPDPLTSCGGPVLIESANALKAARQSFMAGSP